MRVLSGLINYANAAYREDDEDAPRLFLRPETEQIASWIIEQGRIAAAIEASKNVIEMHKAA
jgi:hypothetical protein